MTPKRRNASPPKSRSGSDSSSAERIARGMPSRTFVVPTAIDLLISSLAQRFGTSRSQIVVLAVGQFAIDTESAD
jgi:hypothetical protein